MAFPSSVPSVDSFRSDYVQYLKDQRLNIRVEATLELDDGARMRGTTKNLSYCGAFIELKEVVTALSGEQCILSLVIHDKPEPDALKLRCSIKHFNNEGIGLYIEGIENGEIDDFVFLLANNSPDPEAMLSALSNKYSVELSCNEMN